MRREEKVHPVAFHMGANTVSPTTNSETLGQSTDFIRSGLPQADDTGHSTLSAGGEGGIKEHTEL